MKKDQADEFEQELMQPLAQALRTRLGDAGEVLRSHAEWCYTNVEDVPSSVELRWRPGEDQAALTNLIIMPQPQSAISDSGEPLALNLF